MMEKAHQIQQWWRFRWLNFKNATIVVCLFNLLTALFLLQASFGKFSSSHQPNSVLLRYIKESEEIRRAMIPVDLIKRVREIEKEAHVEPEAVKQKDNKQAAAVDLVSRLNNIRSYSDAGSLKAIEEWRKRKMERARQRELGKNGTVVTL
ncbi:hypothetical protein ACH5RR_032854 [Cinchona calisaya]|uniref:Uncharacterized protein n=1 Tax=Cinchona calisaya TaxID=153742 RepID=A0ABD2YMF9_9GENT